MNPFRHLLKARGARAPIGTWVSSASPLVAEALGHAGFDWGVVDMEHAPADLMEVVQMLQAVGNTKMVPVVRVPWLEPGILMKTLDAGAYAVICPMVNTREDAQKLVAWTSYAPRGTRSFGPVRANLYGGADYAQHANDTIVTFAMIETAQALANLEDILSVPGLDAIYIGPSDLSLSLGCRAVFDDVDPPAAEAIAHILARARAHGLVAGIHCGTPASARQRVAMGFQFVTVGSDARLLAAAAQQVVSQMRADGDGRTGAVAGY